jgi:hypothetical protein
MGPAPETERFGGNDDPEPAPAPKEKPVPANSKTGRAAEAAATVLGEPELVPEIRQADQAKQAQKAAKQSQKAAKRSAGTSSGRTSGSGGSVTTRSTRTTETDSDPADAFKGMASSLWKLTSPWQEAESAKRAIKAEMGIGLMVLLLYPLVRSQGMDGYLTTWTKKLINWVLLFALYLIAASVGGKQFARLFASIGALSVLALLLVMPTSDETTIAASLFTKVQKILDPTNPAHLEDATQGQNEAWSALYPPPAKPRSSSGSPSGSGSGSSGGSGNFQPDLPGQKGNSNPNGSGNPGFSFPQLNPTNPQVAPPATNPGWFNQLLNNIAGNG